MENNYLLRFDEEILANLYNSCTLEEVFDLIDTYKKSKDQIINDLDMCKAKTSIKLAEVLHYHACVFSYIGFQNMFLAFRELEKKCGEDVSINVLWPEVVNLKEVIEKTVPILNAHFPVNSEGYEK